MDLDCGDVRDKLSEFIDQDELDELCRAIEQHLAHCRDCRVEVDTLKKTIVLYRSDRGPATPVTVSAALRSVLAREYGEAPSPSD
jgi:hypothetical protein